MILYDIIFKGFKAFKGFKYNLKDKSELVGHLIIAISPHTVAGIIGRIIGFSRTQGFYAHPLFHSQMRRDIDGDEAGIMLLMDAFLNFSRGLLGTHRGATQDEPLVLSSLKVATYDICKYLNQTYP